jgi:hypothetical protein
MGDGAAADVPILAGRAPASCAHQAAARGDAPHQDGETWHGFSFFPHQNRRDQ